MVNRQKYRLEELSLAVERETMKILIAEKDLLTANEVYEKLQLETRNSIREVSTGYIDNNLASPGSFVGAVLEGLNKKEVIYKSEKECRILARKTWAFSKI